MNHPAVTLGYRIETGGASLVYATDHEPHTISTDPAADLRSAAHQEDDAHVQFLVGADLVIHDAQYTEAEYPEKLGWGHSTAERAVGYALAAGSRRLALFHHDPLRDDDAVDRLVAMCRAQAGGAVEIFPATEGQVIELPEDRGLGKGSPRAFPYTASPGEPADQPRAAVLPAEATQGERTILVVDDEPDIVALLLTVLKSEGYRLLSAVDGPTALKTILAERPDLVLLDWRLPGLAGIEVCREVRRDPDETINRIPIVLLTALSTPEDTRLGFEAGATDYLSKRFTPAHIRSRVTSWLLRSAQVIAPGAI